MNKFNFLIQLFPSSQRILLEFPSNYGSIQTFCTHAELVQLR